MKKILFICTVSLFSLTACNDFLETSSPSEVDTEFIFSNIATTRSVMDGAYEVWRDACQNQLYGDGLFYGTDMAGSDIERHPEGFNKQPGRHWVETLFRNGAHAGLYGINSYSKVNSSYQSLYKINARANAIINAMAKSSDFDKYMSATEPSDFSQLYGEAIALRATAYREACRYFGDVPYATKMGQPARGVTPRDSIYDACIAELIKVEPLMYDLGANKAFPAGNKNYFSRTYVAGLIGRMCLDAAGYQTRQNAIAYKNGKGEVLTFEKMGTDNNDAFYGRRSDWKDLYVTAKKYFEICLEHIGTAEYHAVDPRGEEPNGRKYDNPYQYFFQQMHGKDGTYADESIYEYPMQYGTQDDARSYSFGRVSDGGEYNAFPCKAYGQSRANPAFYYGMFSPNDKRRDVAFSVTGSAGNGTEKLISFEPGSKIAGGITLNKWDENRQSSPWTALQRRSGINGPYMRVSEIYLGYAEACAITGDNGTAKRYLQLIRERSFPQGKSNTDQFITSQGSLFEAIIEERGYEFAGDGDRRWTLLRTGLFPKKIKEVKDLTRAMLDGLKTNGYYEFSNGNVISNYIWTKSVDAKSIYGYRLTAQCPEGKENDPVLNPGWRGQHDSWEALGLDYKTATPKTNLAIKGLYTYIDPNGSEAKALEADGYKKITWGSTLVKNDEEYYLYLFYDYDYVKAPIYLYAFPQQVLQSSGLKNGYGFSQVN